MELRAEEGIKTMRFTVIPHVHWDREWYFTQQKSTLYLLHDMDEVIDQLCQTNDLKYYLFDAQTSLIEDYLGFRPEREDQVRRLIGEGRLVTGPWYTQTDQMIIHGESIVRNLLYGTREAKAFGGCFYVGYAVDCFGQGAQMPQIYKGFGIDKVLFKRGIETSKIPFTEFEWRSDDGSQVFAYHCVDYMNFRNPSLDAKENAERLREIAGAYDSRSLSKEILLFNGFDQHPVRRDILNITAELNEKLESTVQIGRVEEVFDRIKERHTLPRYTGELTCGETSRVHKSIYSSRADIKRMNSRCENQLIRSAEPLQAIYYELTGRDERIFMTGLWKEMMKNAAHDSIGCCNSDLVNRQIMQRFSEVMDSLTEYENLTHRLVANQIPQEPFSLQVYNYLPYEREEEARFKLLSPYEEFSLADPAGRLAPVRVLRRENATQRVKKALAFSNGVNGRYDNFWEDCDHIYECEVSSTLSAPAMGYETYRVVEAKAQDAPGNRLENDFVRIDIDANGSLSIFDKTCNRQYSRMLVFEDQGDAGDSYDYSSVPDDTVLTSEWAQTGNFQVSGNTAGYELEMMIPRNLEQRRAGQMDQRMNIRVELTLQPNKPQCDFKVKVKNPGTDHRLRVKFPTGIKSRFSYADQTFGIIERPTSLEAAECWREKGWTEKPRCIEPMQSYVYLRDEKTAVGVITDSVKEYEIVGDGFDTIAYTLFRSFPKMGRADLEDRPGRASGKEWDTPDAMLIGEMEYTFSLCFAGKGPQVARYAAEYLTPLKIHQEIRFCGSFDEFILGAMEKKLPAVYSSFSVDDPDTQMSIYKLGEDHGTILRLYRLEDGNVDVKAEATKYECRLDETNDEKLEPLKLYKKNQIITIRMEK